MVRVVSVLVAAAAALSLSGCPDATPPPADTPVFGRTEGLLGCDDATVAAHPESRCFTYRAVAGVSMGGGTAGRVGFRHPELFDVVGILGTPFADNEFFFRMLKENHMSGFCSLEQLEQLMADGVDLNDSSNPNVFCGVHDVFPLVDGQQVSPDLFPAVPGSDCAMFRSDFNHWYRGPDAGRAGSFSRNNLINVMHDLMAAFGNPFYDNAASSYFAPGLGEPWYIAPGTADLDAVRRTLCEAPIVLTGVYNREYNPDGSYPVISFCDGNNGGADGTEANDGDYIPDQRNNPLPIEFLVAVDLNGNGQRDYGEPVVINDQERFVDCGSDGLCDGDAGDADDDNWDPDTNPTGTEKNGRLDEGESFDDDGVDGVPGTADFGEDNGSFDRSPTLDGLLNDSPASLYKNMPDAQTSRIDVWMDAGVRDFLNSGQISNSLFAELKARAPSANTFTGFAGLPVDEAYTGSTDDFEYYMPDYSRAAIGQAAYVRYGDTSVCPSSDAVNGDGNHAGIGDVAARVYALFGFFSERMPAQGRDAGFGGDVASLGPTGSLTDFAFMSSFDSQVQNRTVEYGVLLPPDYFVSDEEYPVMYFFHGQGMSADDLIAVGLTLLGPMKESARDDRAAVNKTDLQRSIIIWADGNCLGDECFTGSFYTDFKGLPRDDRRFEAGFYDLARHIESTYRTKKPELVPLDQIEN
jgi:hypothetical protein